MYIGQRIPQLSRTPEIGLERSFLFLQSMASMGDHEEPKRELMNMGFLLNRSSKAIRWHIESNVFLDLKNFWTENL